jgi:hypothetical protein
MKERGNYGTMGKATRLYTKEICVVEVIEHDHFDRGRGGRARPAQSPVLAGSSWPEVLSMGCGAEVTAVTGSPARLVP